MTAKNSGIEDPSRASEHPEVVVTDGEQEQTSCDHDDDGVWWKNEIKGQNYVLDTQMEEQDQ